MTIIENIAEFIVISAFTFALLIWAAVASGVL